jgi:molybdopterin converting factor small subunit
VANRETGLSVINLLFFGRLGDFAKQVPSTMEASTPAEVRELLAADFPDLGKELHQPQVLVSVNKMIVGWDQPLFDGSEVAFLPPVTGG